MAENSPPSLEKRRARHIEHNTQFLARCGLSPIRPLVGQPSSPVPRQTRKSQRPAGNIAHKQQPSRVAKQQAFGLLVEANRSSGSSSGSSRSAQQVTTSSDNSWTDNGVFVAVQPGPMDQATGAVIGAWVAAINALGKPALCGKELVHAVAYLLVVHAMHQVHEVRSTEALRRDKSRMIGWRCA